jgi:phosphatidate phosphatase PAH1
MKKILLFSFLLLGFLFLGDVLAATAEGIVNIDSLEREKRAESFLKRIVREKILSPNRQEECIHVFRDYIQETLRSTVELTSEEKKEMNDCVNEIYKKKFSIMEQKVEKLRKIIFQLQKSGENTRELEETLRLTEENLKHLKKSF